MRKREFQAGTEVRSESEEQRDSIGVVTGRTIGGDGSRKIQVEYAAGVSWELEEQLTAIEATVARQWLRGGSYVPVEATMLISPPSKHESSNRIVLNVSLRSRGRSMPIQLTHSGARKIFREIARVLPENELWQDLHSARGHNRVD